MRQEKKMKAIDLRAKYAGQLPRRLWAIKGRPNTGKSAFAAQLTPATVWVDSDMRVIEVIDLIDGDIYGISNKATDLTDPARISELCREMVPHMPDVKTIVVDTVTAIIEPIIVRTMQELEDGKHQNRAAAWRDKARAMQQVFGLAALGTDMAWIYHTGEHLSGSGKAEETETIPEREAARAIKSLNMILELKESNGVYSVTVEWSRYGKDGFTLTDEAGMWAGMPALIEEASYGTGDMKDWGEGEAPNTFLKPSMAWAWAMEQDAGFRDVAHAENAYNKVKADLLASFEPSEDHPKITASDMRDAWVAEVEHRANPSVEAEVIGTAEALQEGAPEVAAIPYEVGSKDDPLVTAEQLDEAPDPLLETDSAGREHSEPPFEDDTPAPPEPYDDTPEPDALVF
jgi:hypothetical protein